jgi:hypothetical protein
MGNLGNEAVVYAFNNMLLKPLDMGYAVKK